MAKFQLQLPITKDNLILIAICLVGMAALFSLGILPAKKHIAQLDAEIATARQNLSRHDALEPVSLQLDLHQKKDLSGYPTPIKDEKLKQGDIQQAEQFLRGTAGRFGLNVTGMDMDLASAAKGDAGLSVVVKLRGGFDGMRHYLDALSRLPYLGGINELRISEDGVERNLEIKLRLNMG